MQTYKAKPSLVEICPRQRSILIIFMTGVLLASCADKTMPPQVAAPPPPVQPVIVTPPVKLPVIGSKERLINALTYLGRGEADTARFELNAILSERPRDPVASDLLRQIDGDPQKLLGSRSYAYRIRRGETLSDIAGRVLGDRNHFYILARYNKITVPQDARAGQLIKLPGIEPARPKLNVPVRPVTTPPVRPINVVAANPAQANRLRQAGLAQLARGSIDQAVALLRRALTLDPSNPLILADLDSSLRVQRTVHAQ